MIKEVHLIIGLPKSGHLDIVTDFIKRFPQKSVKIIENIFEKIDLRNCTEEAIFVVDPQLCIYRNLLSTEVALLKVLETPVITRIYFENDPEKCLLNATADGDPREVQNAIISLTAQYISPLFAKRVELNSNV